jgi:hypothetical protein
LLLRDGDRGLERSLDAGWIGRIPAQQNAAAESMEVRVGKMLARLIRKL